MATASCPTGAMIMTRSSGLPNSIQLRHHLLLPSGEHRSTTQHTMKFLERLPDPNAPASLQLEFTNSLFMMAAALFDHGQGLFDFSGGFKIAQAYDRISQVAEINRRFGRSD